MLKLHQKHSFLLQILHKFKKLQERGNPLFFDEKLTTDIDKRKQIYYNVKDMSVKTTPKMDTKTITLRLPRDILDFLEEDAVRLRRSKSNYIEWLIYQKSEKDWVEKLDAAADKYFNGKIKTTSVSTKEELNNLLTKMAK